LFTNHDLQNNNNNNNKTKRDGLKIQYLTQTLKDNEKRNSTNDYRDRVDI